jgi:membrane associated rhomboid family serine protease
LATAIRQDRDASVTLVWAPGHERMILPEELAGMGDSLRTARDRWTRDDLENAERKLRWFGTVLVLILGYTFVRGFLLAAFLAAQSGTTVGFFERLKFATHAVLASTQSGLVLLIFTIFGFIPWYQARKRRAALGKWTEAGIAAAVPTIRFETWLERQTAPLTKVFLAMIALVALVQMFAKVSTEGISVVGSLLHNWDGSAAAGLVKERYLQHGEWWRLFTAPFLHGNIVHLLMNGAAMAYLGKRLEVFARWPHLPLVFLFSACIGGEASARFIEAPSVGASGGLMGWLGFLLVFETLHERWVPLRARRRLAAGVAITALIGVIGYRYIDNAAHAGGLIAGMVYAAIVFPSSSSSRRPQATSTDRIAGGAALAVLLAAVGCALWKLLGSGTA